MITQDKIADVFVLGDAVVHVCTDDPMYRAMYRNVWETQISENVLQFGPNDQGESYEDRGCSADDMNFVRFKRETLISQALLDFAFLSLCDRFIGTAGSTVTEVVQLLNKKWTDPFISTDIIGAYPTQTKPTAKFRNECKEFIENSYEFFFDRSATVISHEQANVLDFFNDNHLAEMHSVLESMLKANEGPMLGSEVGKKLYDQCRVARYNKYKFKEEPGVTGGQHWMKALLRGRMHHYSSTTPRIANHIIITDDNVVLLQPKPSNLSYVPGSSSSSGLPSKRHRSN